ncbi:hypothetical protein [Salmonella phage vB_SenM-S16]|uniref:Uncharacterized protein n=1 Tax=Salmonella phage S16 TaxID=1087482 RepID=M1H999_BPS16|nr:hypothetical protein I133_gp037 [Salmonella phage vB_SenM-S16]UJJ22234.1 hypothetical protein [Erwinia phage Virsaitis27]UPW42344.1 hypothetical protein EBPHNEJP_00046 [Salmonella phage CF-SP2]WDR21894.1 hypothetical protein PJM34_0226 [Salmonella phage vB_SenM_UTK0003]WKV23580.1 hypothetical protein SEA1_gp0232 [Salmonella phage SEA1]AGE48209.1 hypothetical protein [Salmonella phage vB_SenM-S16]
MKILTDWECKYCGGGLLFAGGICPNCKMRQG